MAERTYSHTQVSYWLTGLSLLSAAIVAVTLSSKDPPWVFFAVLAFGVVVALIFSRLTVVVDDQAVMQGWLYNVEGLGATELRMRNGRRYRIGTDEPERLETAIKDALSAPDGEMRNEDD